MSGDRGNAASPIHNLHSSQLRDASLLQRLIPVFSPTFKLNMAGHNKWSKIKRGKAVVDAKRGNAFSKLAKEMLSAEQVAACTKVSMVETVRIKPMASTGK